MNKLALSMQARQRGVVLVISLLMLLVLTVIGLAATRSTALEERMASNQNDREVAFESAEAALRYAEGLLNAAAQPDFAANANGAYLQATMASSVYWNNNAMWDSTTSNTEPYGDGIISSGQNLIVAGDGTGTVTSSQPPRYYIVYSIQPANATGNVNLVTTAMQKPSTAYFIYARGYGMSPNDTVTLEAVDSF